jgi:hypothetical protein
MGASVYKLSLSLSQQIFVLRGGTRSLQGILEISLWNVFRNNFPHRNPRVHLRWKRRFSPSVISMGKLFHSSCSQRFSPQTKNATARSIFSMLNFSRLHRRCGKKFVLWKVV